MLPLDTVGPGGQVSRARALAVSLMALRSAGVEGVMVDVWWGVVERDGPGRYDWEGYAELVRMVERAGLRLQMVMSFHQCGGNVGDSCNIPLPPWVLEEVNADTDIVYTDRSGRRNPEYISLGCDTLPVLKGRTPVQVYSDYMRSFRDRFSGYLGTVIAEAAGLSAFTYLRMNRNLFDGDNWRRFVAFVKTMADGGARTALPRCDTGHSDLYVGFVDAAKEQRAPESEAAAAL
ncbi:unnamed protein product [Triticum turgidum subsp. durum]|uniref:Beta-amylase n=1 Tax=Triticum turgidum subsp. durum TaxID=4567 RepID=A0A9R0VA00_TRITD|nr:unnamed protein product [Triticum turgidum subsp. durum]